ncbi:MAG: cupin-like domain-containing protein, partial [Povalibacter sp.]
MLSAESQQDSVPLSTLECLPRIAAVRVTSAEQFAATVALGKPVVIKDAFSHWPSLDAGRASPVALNEYLKRMDTGALVPVMEAPPSTGGWYFYS